MATISISQLDTATQAKVDDLYEVAVVDANSQTGYASRKLTAAQIATLIAQGVQFSGLSTEAKTIIAAINEAAQNGGTEVEANPTGEATDTLEKIGIDGTVYEVGATEPVSKTATGNPISITDAADAPIVSGTVAFEPIQDLHGYNKPWAGGNGFNKIDENNMEVGRIDGSGQNIPVTSNTHWRTRDYFPVLPSTVYYNRLSTNFTTSNANNNIYYYDANKQFLTIAANIGNSTFTTPDGCAFVRISSFFVQEQTTYPTGLCLNVSDASKNGIWEPYSNICPITGYDDCEVEVTDDATTPTTTKTYTIDLDGTRHSGTVDLVSGEMKVDRKYKKGFTRGVIDSSGKLYKIDELSDAVNITSSSGVADLDVSNMGIFLGLVPARASADFCLAHFATSFYVGGMVGKETELDALLPNLEIVYELATPLTIQLTPEQIRTLQGTNNISTNMTNMSLEYITQDYQPLVKLIERSAGHHYSTQERVVGTWIDGKPLYEKVVDFGALPNTDTKTVAHNISNIDEIISCQGTAKRTTGDFYPIPYASTTSSSNVAMYANSTDINIVTGFDRSYETAYVTLQYTKTTS